MIGAPIAALFALVTVLAFAFFQSVSLEHDATARQADTEAVAHSLEAVQASQRALAIDYAFWDAAFENVTVRWDQAFVDENYYTELADALLIASEAAGIRYRWFGPNVSADQTELAAAMWAVLPAGLDRTELTRPDSGDIMPRSFLREFNGAPLIVTIIPFRPEDAALLSRVEPTKEPDFLLVGSRLDPAQLSALGARLGLEDLVFVETREGRPGRAFMPLEDARGAPIGYISWRDRLPGTSLFNDRVWVLLSGFGLLLLLAAWVIARSVQHSLKTSEAARAAAESARQAAERASTAKSQFLAAMSHELRTPLNAIIGYSEIIAEGAEEDQREGDLHDTQKVLSAARHLLALINQVLDHATVEAGSVTLNPAPTSLASIANDVAAMARPIALRNKTTLALIGADTLGEELVDAVRLKQCLMNIVGNAVKFAPSGQVRITCARTRTEGLDWAVFSVADTGIGMSSDTLERLFTPFMQADRSYSRAFEGTGLGLAITKQLLDLMGGRIDVASEVGVGTTVTVHIPLPSANALATTAPHELAAALRRPPFGPSFERRVLQ